MIRRRRRRPDDGPPLISPGYDPPTLPYSLHTIRERYATGFYTFEQMVEYVTTELKRGLA